MWNTTKWAGSALVALTMTAAGCSGDHSPSSLLGPGASKAAAAAATVYDQVEFLGNPLVSEVTIVKANHEPYNKTQPYNTATFKPQTEQFIMQVGGRPASYAATVAGVLYPDMLIVDSSKDPSTAGWLSWALANGYGGRKLSDDVVDIGLSAIFSSLLSPTGASCAPFQLPLCTDNVSANNKAFSSTFPYLASPNT
jgi:Domain of unknown function (DUF4331)